MKKTALIITLLQLATSVLLLIYVVTRMPSLTGIFLVFAALICTCFVGWYFIRPLVILDEDLTAAARQKTPPETAILQLAEKLPLGLTIKQVIDHSANNITQSILAEVFDQQAQLTALQSQINPHFLYNTLESIRGQALIDDNDEIADMIEALASFFRYSISRSGNLVTLRDELVNIENYMLIQRYRFNNRFSLAIEIEADEEEILDQLIPKLSIQPIVENAIFHGLEEKMEDGTITIEAYFTASNFILMVSDNGCGMSHEDLAKLNAKIQTPPLTKNSSARKTGIGLPNINKRIELLFGPEYDLHVYSSPGYGTDVELILPRNIKEVTNHDEERNSANS